jgi:hypothetical protein
MAENEGDATAAAAATEPPTPAPAAEAEPPAEPAAAEPEAEPGSDAPDVPADAKAVDLSSWQTEMAEGLTDQADRPRRQMIQLAQTNAQLKKIVEYNHGLVGEVVSKMRDDLIRPFFTGWKQALAEELERGRRERKGIKLVGGVEMRQRGKDGTEQMLPVVVGRGRLRDLLWHWFSCSRLERNDKRLIRRNLQRQVQKIVALGFYTMLDRVDLKKRRANIVKKVFKRLVGVRVACAWKGWHAHYLHEKHNRVKVRRSSCKPQLPHSFPSAILCRERRARLSVAMLLTDKLHAKEACVQQQHAKPSRLETFPSRVETPPTSRQAITGTAQGAEAARCLQWMVPGVDSDETQPRIVGQSFGEVCAAWHGDCSARVGQRHLRHAPEFLRLKAVDVARCA